MNFEFKKLLLPFYFGTIEEKERLFVEQELLIDSESLVDYLDLKRKLENALEVPQVPSPALWNKLQLKLKTAPRKKLILSLSFGALAASLLIIAMVFFKLNSLDQSIKSNTDGILFDSNGELPARSTVL